MMPTLVFAAWYLAVCVFLVPLVAHEKGREGFLYGILAVIFTPLLVLLALAAMPEIPRKEALPKAGWMP